MALKSELQEFSVVYTDRALNLMSAPFQQVMKDISSTLKRAYNANAVAIVPGSGTFAMESVARQFATKKEAVIVRNGYFSFRWSEILESDNIPSACTVIKARPTEDSPQPHFAPPPIAEVVKTIQEKKPETATGIILPPDYLKQIGTAVRNVGGFFVLDCIASGNVWVDMEESLVDVLISAPQKGWSGPACCGLVMLNERAKEEVNKSQSTSFSLNLRKWLEVMDKYESGAFMYYTTLPTDSLAVFRDVLAETTAYGFEKIQQDMWTLGNAVRAELEARGFKSVAAEGFKSPGVVVSYSNDPQMVLKFKQQGIQIAAGVPFKVDEPEGLVTFRIGLFGIDKMQDTNLTVEKLKKALDEMTGK